MAFDDEVELLRQRIEKAMNEKYEGVPDSAFTRASIAADLQLLSEIFPELDITAVVYDDPADAPPPPLATAVQWLKRYLDTW